MSCHHGCSIFIWMVLREMKGKVGEVGVRMYNEGRKWVLNSFLFADDTVLLAENESDLKNLVSVFDSAGKRRKLEVNVNKSEVICIFYVQ